MAQSSLLELAKQGDADAISALINHQFNPKGITAKTAVTDGCLQIILEAATLPPEEKIVSYIKNSMNKLGAASISKVLIYGKNAGNEFPLWQNEFALNIIQTPLDLPVDALAIKVDETREVQDAVLLECSGIAAILIVKTSGIIIRRLGGMLSVHSKGERFIAYKNIVNIHFQNPKGLAYGFIYFQLVGSTVSTIGYSEAASDQDSVPFVNVKLPDFDKARFLISENVDLPKQSIVSQQSNPPASVSVDAEVSIRCPKCGSGQIAANKKGFNVGQALVGGVLTLGIGVAAGLWGSNEIRVNCLKCGHRWKPR
jgi:hypothetical protein